MSRAIDICVLDVVHRIARTGEQHNGEHVERNHGTMGKVAALSIKAK